MKISNDKYNISYLINMSCEQLTDSVRYYLIFGDCF